MCAPSTECGVPEGPCSVVPVHHGACDASAGCEEVSVEDTEWLFERCVFVVAGQC